MNAKQRRKIRRLVSKAFPVGAEVVSNEGKGRSISAKINGYGVFPNSNPAFVSVQLKARNHSLIYRKVRDLSLV